MQFANAPQQEDEFPEIVFTFADEDQAHASCARIFNLVESFSRCGEAEKRPLRARILAEQGVVAQILHWCRHASREATRVAAMAALSEITFALADPDLLRMCYDAGAIETVSSLFVSASSLGMRLFCAFAVCNLNANSVAGLQHSWDAAVLEGPFLFLATYLACKDILRCSGLIRCVPVSNFSVCPDSDPPLLGVAAEPLDRLRRMAADDAEPDFSEMVDGGAGPEVALLMRHMSVGPHRVVMYLIGLFVIFSRNEGYRDKTRDLRLGDLSLYRAYRAELEILYDADPAAAAVYTPAPGGAAPKRRRSLSHGLAPALAASAAACGLLPSRSGTGALQCTARLVHFMRRHLLRHPLFDPDTSPVDLALHAVESRDDFYAYIAASMCAYQKGADESGALPVDTDSEEVEEEDCDWRGTGADGEDGAVTKFSSEGAPLPRLRSRSAQVRHRLRAASLPSEVINMLLEAANAGLDDRMYKGFAAYAKIWTYLQPLAVIAIADANKGAILRLGGVETAARALSHPDSRTRQFAAQLMWLLAFDAAARDAIVRLPGAVEALRLLAKTGDTAERANATGALWQLRAATAAAAVTAARDRLIARRVATAVLLRGDAYNNDDDDNDNDVGSKLVSVIEKARLEDGAAAGIRPRALSAAVDCTSKAVPSVSRPRASSLFGDGEATSGTGARACAPHVMLSYERSDQALVMRIRDGLAAAGHAVWVDASHMSGSSLSAMAEAVERAAVVVCCVSRRYRESANCRSEAEYAYACGKDIVPLMMQASYRPEGWLGVLLAAKSYLDFSAFSTSAAAVGLVVSADALDEASTIRELANELRGRGCIPQAALKADAVVFTIDRDKVAPEPAVSPLLVRHAISADPAPTYAAAPSAQSLRVAESGATTGDYNVPNSETTSNRKGSGRLSLHAEGSRAATMRTAFVSRATVATETCETRDANIAVSNTAAGATAGARGLAGANAKHPDLSMNSAYSSPANNIHSSTRADGAVSSSHSLASTSYSPPQAAPDFSPVKLESPAPAFVENKATSASTNYSPPPVCSDASAPQSAAQKQTENRDWGRRPPLSVAEAREWAQGALQSREAADLLAAQHVDGVGLAELQRLLASSGSGGGCGGGCGGGGAEGGGGGGHGGVSLVLRLLKDDVGLIPLGLRLRFVAALRVLELPL